ncbi:DUF1178 family protein [Pseudooceanicola sp.]|uniref:DUF1178 family protein n=1 Tax=Pseudooceanicola sp. TaxID=1914328 RepID=UPI002631A371|nr:DUF1178 family protein [Pseudooceanicola sp.]MDF1856701.1 DUF1178 family protein [Pseudooceanicola sp.]
MIQFSLKCPNDHRFDSWFQSAEAFEKLAAAGMVSCAICGANKVEKAVMAPRVATSRTDKDQPKERPLSAPRSPAEQALTELRRKIEAQSEDVGRDFARQARAIHDGDMPDRAIRGEARVEEARALIEDGVPIVPLPFAASRKSN